MNAFWTFFIERRQFTALVIVALVVAGIVAALAIPKENAPEVVVPVALIQTTLRGASAVDTAKLITKEIEKEVANVDNLKKVTSSSREGVSIVSAEFEASADVDKSIQDVKDAVDKAKPRLPRDADEPIVVKITANDQPIFIVSLSGGLPPAEFTRLAKEVQDELEAVPGVGRVEISGNQEREVTIVVRKEALDAYGISLSEIVAALSASNSSIPVGNITVDEIEYAVAFKGDLEDPKDLIQTTVGNVGGAPVYLRDVADIVDGVEKARSISRTSIEGAPSEPAVTLAVYKKTGGNIFATAKGAKDKLDELQKTTLAGITTNISIDLGKDVEDSLTELTTVGLETIILVMLCLVATIGWRESVVAGLSIPLSFVIAFIGLYFSGNTINFVSLFALILAIGILVDSGIVVTEAIHTRFKKYGDAAAAAKEAIREYARPLTAGTMTTVAMFFPLFFISGVVGQYIQSIPFTIITVLIASIFVALGLVPLIALKLSKRTESKFEAMQEEWNTRAQVWYREFLTGILRNRKFQVRFMWGITIAFVIAIMLPASGLVKVLFFPQENGEYVFLEIETKQGTPLEETDLAVRAVEEMLYGDTRIDSFVTTVGGSSAFSQTQSSGPKYANITVKLLPKEKRKETSSEITEEYRKKTAVFHEFDVRAFEPQGGPPSGAPVLITFSGENLDDLERAVDLGERVLNEIPGTAEVTTSIKDDGTQFALTIDRAKAAQVGLSPAQVAGTLRTAVSGVVATTIKKDEEDIDVLVVSNLNPEWNDPKDAAKADVDALLNLPIKTPRGTVLLGSIVSPSIEKSNAVIRREDQKNIATVSSYTAEGKTPIEISAAFKSAMEKEEMPSGVVMNVGGETEDVDQSFSEMGIAFIAGLVLMYAILVFEFNSIRFAWYLIMLTILALIGVMTGLAITGQPFSFSSLLGIIALAGVIINHAIILIDSIIVRMQNPQGKTLEEIVVDGSASRLRPIVLTTITTVVGMIPLAGASALWGPLAYAIMFGLTFAMVLTLVLTPILVYRNPGKQFWNPEA
ncbi:efflux RND transporter permease subunit [Patescibacteria group bacterium]|nr:efflux RND transporter permease subunit [Patescibacteria group bacterium]